MQYESEVLESKDIKECKLNRASNVNVRMAKVSDANKIYNVAVSVGKGKNESTNGFLMDNYRSNPSKFKKKFEDNIKNLKFVYVAEIKDKVVGFLIGYTKDEWVAKNSGWLGNVNWKTGFDLKKTEKFILTDKIAIISGLGSCGIGSKIYKKYMKDLRKEGIEHIFSETLIDPVPNFASLSFRKKQSFKLAGTSYEKENGIIYTSLVYYKPVNKKPITS